MMARDGRKRRHRQILGGMFVGMLGVFLAVVLVFGERRAPESPNVEAATEPREPPTPAPATEPAPDLASTTSPLPDKDVRAPLTRELPEREATPRGNLDGPARSALPRIPRPYRAQPPVPGLAEEEIRRVVDGQGRSLAACLDRFAPASYRRFELALVIEPNGEVSRAEVHHPRLSRDDKDCIATKARGWKFRASGDAARRSVRVPFIWVQNPGS